MVSPKLLGTISFLVLALVIIEAFYPIFGIDNTTVTIGIAVFFFLAGILDWTDKYPSRGRAIFAFLMVLLIIIGNFFYSIPLIGDFPKIFVGLLLFAFGVIHFFSGSRPFLPAGVRYR